MTATEPLARLRFGARARSDGRRLYWWVEVVAILAFYEVYSFVRNANEGGASAAFRHARQLIRWERMLGMYHEVGLQHAALHARPLVITMNYIYGSLHFVVTGFVIVYLFRRWTDDYSVWRTTLAFTTALALIGFVFWPLMPPRLLPATYGYVDTLAKYPTFWSFNSGAMSKISNQYAAMPSLHFGWSLFCACALVTRLPRRGTKMLAAAYPVLTLAAIVLTANHYVLDAVGGAVAFAAGYGLARVRR